MYTLTFVLMSCIFVSLADPIVYPCVTPDGQNGYCISLFSCPNLMRSLSTLEHSAIKYVMNSMCLGCEVGNFMVCCKAEDIILETTTIPAPTIKPQSSPFVNPNKKPKPTKRKKFDLLPNTKYCGFQHKDDRIYNGSATAIDEFPWLVHIRFSNMEYEEQYADRCTGVLINNRYVLTDAYCGVEAIKVKLGEYNTNKSVSCDTRSVLTDCTENTIDVAVEEIIREKLNVGYYGFSLLRLGENIQYSDFIRPICLPLDKSDRPSLNSLTFSGWGSPNATGISKKVLKYDVVPDDECYKHDETLQQNIISANVTFICTVPRSDNTVAACNGEHGGPFMYEMTRKHQWYLEGIVCHVMYDVPDDYTGPCTNTLPVTGIRITPDTIKWIRANIRP